MYVKDNNDVTKRNLTLTSVVFESSFCITYINCPVHLTLTSVVFEFFSPPKEKAQAINLTLTSVVFEFKFT